MNEINQLHKRASKYMIRNDLHSAFPLLNESLDLIRAMEDLPGKFDKLVICYTLLSQYYHRSNSLDKALEILMDSIQYENEVSPITVAKLHINLSGIFSIKGEHGQALHHASRAVKVLQSNFEGSRKLLKTIVVAYYALGIEYEFLLLNKEASECFHKAYALGEENLNNLPIVNVIRQKINRTYKLPFIYKNNRELSFTPIPKFKKTGKHRRHYNKSVDIWDYRDVSVSLNKKLNDARVRLDKTKRRIRVLVKAKERLRNM